MKRLILAPIFIFTLILIGCTSVETQAYRTIVAAKAFLNAEKKVHPECATGTVSATCSALAHATSAKDALIDAVEVYCSGPAFDTGGACDAPAKGTPAATQAEAKLKAAIASYDQAAKDLKGAL